MLNGQKDVVDNIQAIKTEIEDFKYEAERAA
jgi:ATP-dependent Clp protease ATP-binding subunit ClpB